MNALTHMSDIMIPMVIFWIVGYGMVSGVKVYETFLKGAKEGLRIVVEILPTLVGLMMAVGILRTSGFFDLLGHLIGPATQAVHFGFTGEKLVAILIMLGSPTTVSCYIMAKNMNHEGTLTSSVVVATTFLSSVTLTVFLFILRSLQLI